VSGTCGASSRAERPDRRGILARARDAFAHAFAMPGKEPLAGPDEALLDKVARAVARRRMQPAALFLLEQAKPFHGLLFQAGVFATPLLDLAEPLATRILKLVARDEFTLEEVRRLALLFERPDTVEALARRIEAAADA